MLQRVVRICGAVGLIVAAACGGGDGGQQGAGSGEPVRGGRLVYGLTAETPSGFCLPEAELDQSGKIVASAIYDTLTVPNGEGDYVPYLARSVTPNETYDEWTITLRPGVRFHDGSRLDAQVVKNNLDAYRGAYDSRRPLFTVFVFENVAGVEVVDDLTLRISTTTPWPAFPAFLHFGGTIGILAQAQLDDAASCDREPIGTGPFAFEDWAPNSHLTVVRNPHYWRPGADGDPLPYLDEIEFRIVGEPSQMLNGVEAGELDAGYFNKPQTIAALQQAADSGALSAAISNEASEVRHILFNEARPPFDDVDARRAVALALDPGRVADVVSGGVNEPANGPFAPGGVGHLDDTGYETNDPAAARDAVARYEEENGEPLAFTLLTAADSDSAAEGQLLQEMISDAGVEVDLELVDETQLIEQGVAGEYQATVWLNHPGGDPDMQYVWWHSESPLNFAAMDDPEVDDLLAAGRTETGPTERAAVYEDLNRRMAEQVHGAWFTWNTYAVGSTTDVHSLTGGPLPDGSEPFGGLGNGHRVDAVWIEP